MGNPALWIGSGILVVIVLIVCLIAVARRRQEPGDELVSWADGLSNKERPSDAGSDPNPTVLTGEFTVISEPPVMLGPTFNPEDPKSILRFIRDNHLVSPTVRLSESCYDILGWGAALNLAQYVAARFARVGCPLAPGILPEVIKLDNEEWDRAPKEPSLL